MRPPQRISPAARSRRALLVDLIAAVLLAAFVLQTASGLGVVGFFGLPLLLLLLLWVCLERVMAGIRRRRGDDSSRTRHASSRAG